jgi:hypothetical protein
MNAMVSNATCRITTIRIMVSGVPTRGTTEISMSSQSGWKPLAG